MSVINIRRVATLPETLAPSCIYIVKTDDPRFVDLYFTNETGSEVRRVVNVVDVENQIQARLETWVPLRSLRADSWVNPITINLTGDVIGQVVFDGSQNVIMNTVANSGGGPVVESDTISFDDYIDLNESGGPVTTAVNLVKPFPEWPNNPDHYSLKAGDLIRAKGNVLLHFFHTLAGVDAQATWDIDFTIRVTYDGKANIVSSNVTKIGTYGDFGDQDYTLTVGTVNAYTPTPEESAEGFLPKPPAFWLSLKANDWRPVGTKVPHVKGRLRFLRDNSIDNAKHNV